MYNLISLSLNNILKITILSILLLISEIGLAEDKNSKDVGNIKGLSLNKEHKLREEIIKKIDYSDEELSEMSEEFQEYYLTEVRPKLVELVLRTRIYYAQMKRDLIGDEAILIGDTTRPSAWGPKNFIAIVVRDKNQWYIKEFKVVPEGSTNCDSESNCSFQYWRISLNPKTPNHFIGAVITYAYYGASGHSFYIHIIGWNRYNENYYINTDTSVVPLIPDYTWE